MEIAIRIKRRWPFRDKIGKIFITENDYSSEGVDVIYVENDDGTVKTGIGLLTYLHLRGISATESSDFNDLMELLKPQDA